MKGVDKVDMDFPKGEFTLTVSQGTTIAPSHIRSVVRSRFKIPSIQVVEMPGKVAKSKGKWRFTPAGQKVAYTLANPKDKDNLKDVAKGAAKLTGELSEVSVKSSKKKMLVCAVTKITAAKDKKDK